MSDRLPILSYFNDAKGRAELTRLIFMCGNVAFEDRGIDFQEFLQMRKQGKLPYTQLPILQVGDTIISQSCAISRYAAKIVGLYPRDIIEAARSDEIVDAWRDLLDIFYDCYVDRVVDGDFFVMKMRDIKVRIARLNDFFTVTLKPYLQTFEKILANLPESSFLVGNCLTWADLAVFNLLCNFDPDAYCWREPSFFYIKEENSSYSPPKELFKDYPKLQAMSANIAQIPAIAARLEANPY